MGHIQAQRFDFRGRGLIIRMGVGRKKQPLAPEYLDFLEGAFNFGRRVPLPERPHCFRSTAELTGENLPDQTVNLVQALAVRVQDQPGAVDRKTMNHS